MSKKYWNHHTIRSPAEILTAFGVPSPHDCTLEFPGPATSALLQSELPYGSNLHPGPIFSIKLDFDISTVSIAIHGRFITSS